MTKYRADIDGLRAIAVLSVVFGHARLPGFSGGFVGVDVFFVISGFLITSILRDEMDRGRYSILAFYDRRIRRILPALFVVLAVTTTIASFVLLPDDFDQYGRSLIATTAFLSNVFFWREVGYFDDPAEFNPLLHSWSLAVEEQFYIIFPIVLFLIFRFWKRGLAPALWLGAILSFVISVWAVGRYPGGAFYLLPSRAWELLLGSLLAIGAMPIPRTPLFREGMGLVGLGLIAAAVLAYDDATSFPGAAALLPCLGAVFLIMAGAGHRTIATRFLSLRPMVFIGLISYSLYLWHWPLLAFARYIVQRPLDALEIGVLISAAFLFAILSWRYVERPFRNRSAIAFRPLVGVAGVASVAAVAAGFFIVFNQGLPGRIPQDVIALASGADDVDPRVETCRAGIEKGIDFACSFGASSAEPSFALIGDSHAEALLPAVDAAALKGGRKGVLLAEPSCKPTLGVATIRSGVRDEDCTRFIDEVADYLDRHPNIRHLILASRWTFQANGSGFGTPPAFYVDGQSKEASVEENRATLYRGLDRFFDRFRDRHLVVVDSIPENEFWVPTAHAMAALFDLPTPRTPIADVEARNAPVEVIFRHLAARHDFDMVTPAALLCARGFCESARDRRALYFDDDHLNRFGGRIVSPVFAGVMSQR